MSFPGHEGSKASHVVYLNDDNRLFTTGSSRMSDRQYAMWDLVIVYNVIKINSRSLSVVF